jgi:hypothetical protein
MRSERRPNTVKKLVDGTDIWSYLENKSATEADMLLDLEITDGTNLRFIAGAPAATPFS